MFVYYVLGPFIYRKSMIFFSLPDTKENYQPFHPNLMKFLAHNLMIEGFLETADYALICTRVSNNDFKMLIT